MWLAKQLEGDTDGGIDFLSKHPGFGDEIYGSLTLKRYSTFVVTGWIFTSRIILSHRYKF